MTRKPEGSSGASSAKDSSMGAKTSCAHAPAAFSSTPLHNCQRIYNVLRLMQQHNWKEDKVKMLSDLIPAEDTYLVTEQLHHGRGCVPQA
jgi:hypothetical protein